MPNTYTISNGGAIISGNINGNISIDAYGMLQSSPMVEDLPPITMSGRDENGRPVTMTLSPEASISNSELTKLLMLSITMVSGSGRSLNALAYVKKHNLERHFTYS